MRTNIVTHNDSQFDENGVNLTPLIDVVFVVLIMFILIAPLVNIDRIQLAPAAETTKKTHPSTQETIPMTIHVYADNTIWVNGKPIADKELFSFLSQVKQRMPSVVPQVYHDRTAYFGTYQVVKNALEAAGFDEMDIILKPAQ